MPALVTVSELTKAYGNNIAVDSISFTIDNGTIHGLLGPNGAGKTTTISLISGLISPDSGNIMIDNYDLNSNPLAAKRLMGIVPQEIALYPTLTARENLSFWGRLYGLNRSQLATRSDQVLSLVELSDRANEPIDNFSGGMKRRLNIAVGLLHNPKLLLLDEPTVGVDPQSRRSILDTIKQLNDDGITVLYTSHYMEEVEQLCHDVTIMDCGKIIAAGKKDELRHIAGSNEVIQMETDSEPNLEPIKQLPGVKGITSDQSSHQITVADSQNLIAPIIAAITDQGISVSTISVQKPNLETVFLHLTGRALRDQE